MLGRLLSFSLTLVICAIPCLSRTQDPSVPPTQPATSSTTPAPQPDGSATPKKVWDNENLPKNKTSVSVVGDKRNQNYKMGAVQPADAATAARIKKDLAKLQTELDDVNTKLKTYKEFQEGEPVSKGERDLSKGYSRTPVDQQMAKLLEKKKALEGQISDLVDEARKKGVDPGQLR